MRGRGLSNPKGFAVSLWDIRTPVPTKGQDILLAGKCPLWSTGLKFRTRSESCAFDQASL